MEINPSVWAFFSVLFASIFSYLSSKKKNKIEGASTLVEAGVSLLEQYRLANQECQDELENCKKELSDK